MLRYMVKNTYKYKMAILNDNMILTQVDKKKKDFSCLGYFW